MKLARYIGNGQIAIVEEPEPSLPEGGLLVRTEACGLCSGELMDWYMDRKVPHVLGHEVVGAVVASDDSQFEVGSRVFVHHHAACGRCAMCRTNRHAHCEQWRATKLMPGGMAEVFAVPRENLDDAFAVGPLRPVDAALIEPLGCVLKSLDRVELPHSQRPTGAAVAVVGLGPMGLMHLLLLPGAIGYELRPERREWAHGLGLEAREPDQAEPADIVFVCPGTPSALEFAAKIVNPGGAVVLFAPMGGRVAVDLDPLYFKDVTLHTSYSCGPKETSRAARVLRQGALKAEQVVSDFVTLEELPSAYEAMKRGDILKAMVLFG